MDLIKFMSLNGEVVISKSFIASIKETMDIMAIVDGTPKRKLIEITTKNIDSHKQYHTITVESTVEDFIEKYLPELNSGS